MRILIIKCGALGDVLRTTALLPSWARRYPGGEVWWVTSPQARPLLEGNPHIARCLTAGPGLLSELSHEDFDRVLSLEEDPECAGLEQAVRHRRWTGVLLRSGALTYTPDSAPYYDMSLLNTDPDGGHTAADSLKRGNRRTFGEIWLEILGLGEPAAGAKPVLVLTAEERSVALRAARSRGFAHLEPRIGVSPGAGTRWPAKRLPPAVTLGLGRAVWDRWGVPAILLGGPEERTMHARLARQPAARLIDAGTGHPLRVFAAMVELCDGIVTSDSLTLHIANALGKPVVAVFGPTSSHEIRVDRGIKLAPSGGCRCFYRRRCASPSPCLETIAPGPCLEMLGRFLVANCTQ